jgi:phosphate:Na+ symporter
LIFINKEKAKSTGEAIIALLFSLSVYAILKVGTKHKENIDQIQFLSYISNNGYLSVLLFVLIGTALTIIVQSSSATMAITITLAVNGWISFEIAAAMCLGENIGTTITAILASLPAGRDAKRAAFHIQHSI